MSFYNMINGVNTQVVVLFLPMLGKHYDEYPRFRDAFLTPMKWTIAEGGMPVIAEINEGFEPKERYIYVLTRVGGGNRDEYATEIATMRAMPEYVEDYDDEFDSTYATFVFEVNSQWSKEYDNIIEGKGISEEYRNHIKKVLPNIAGKIGL